MSKFRKWHLREPKFAKFPGGACPRTPLEARAFGANNYSLFSITWGWNLCGWSPRTSLFGGSLYRGFNIFVIMTSCSTALTSSSICCLFKTMERLDCKKVRIFAYSSKREQSNKRSGTRLKTESETGERRFFPSPHTLRARKTLTPRFTNFLTYFAKKTDCFAVYGKAHLLSLPWTRRCVNNLDI